MQLQAAEEGVPHLPVAQGANRYLSLFDLYASSGKKKSDFIIFISLSFFLPFFLPLYLSFCLSFFQELFIYLLYESTL